MPHIEFATAKLPPQIHAASKVWTGTFTESPIDGLIGNFKPKFGFWTSSDRGNGETAWLDLCRDPSRNEIQAVEVHLFEVVATPRIWVLVDDQQLIDAAIALHVLPDYSNEPDWHLYADVDPMGKLDDWIKAQMELLLEGGEFWGALRAHADAVHVPRTAKFSEPWLSSFEIESTCWFEPDSHLRRVSVKPWP